MADSNTTTYSFTLPEVGASADSWGTKLNANWDKVDDLLDGSIAVNGITVTGGSIDGTPVGATTPSTGEFTSVDVTGTVTADGLTISGSSTGTLNVANFLNTDSSANATANRLGLGISNSSGANYTYIEAKEVGADNFAEMNFYTGISPTKRMTIGTYGDFHLYEDTGTTAKFVWDSSAESLSVNKSNNGTPIRATGTTSGANEVTLDLMDSATGKSLKMLASGASYNYAGISGSETALYTYGTNLNLSADGGEIKLNTGSAGAAVERLRIDSSGNVGIGTASPSAKLTSSGVSGTTLIQALGGDSNGNADVEIKSTGTSGSSRLFFSDTAGQSGALKYAHSTNSMSFETNNTERMRLDSSGNLLVGTTSILGPLSNGGAGITLRPQGNAYLGSTAAPLFLNRSGSDGEIVNLRKDGLTVGSISSVSGGFLSIGHDDVNLNFRDDASIPRVIPRTGAGGSSDGVISFGDAGSRFKDLYLSGGVKATGMTRLGYTAGNLNGYGAENVSGVFYSGNTSSGYTAMNSDSANGCLYLSRTSSAPTGLALSFASNGAQVGSVTITGSSTSYNTSSDYRLKENVTSMDNASDRVLALNPCRFNFITDPDTTVDGFLAHEAQEVVPEAVHGTKDGMKTEEYEVSPAVEATYDEDGNELTPAVEAVMGTREVPDYQGIDQSKLVPLLTKALQEALTRIEALENANGNS